MGSWGAKAKVVAVPGGDSVGANVAGALRMLMLLLPRLLSFSFSYPIPDAITLTDSAHACSAASLAAAGAEGASGPLEDADDVVSYSSSSSTTLGFGNGSAVPSVQSDHSCKASSCIYVEHHHSTFSLVCHASSRLLVSLVFWLIPFSWRMLWMTRRRNILVSSYESVS